MDGLWEIVVVAAAVAVAAVWALRGLWQSARKRQVCSSCASSGGCPMAGGGTDEQQGSGCIVPELSPLRSAEGED